MFYIRATNHSRRACQQYSQEGEIDLIPQHCVPASFIHTSEGTVLRRSIRPPLAILTTTEDNFWDYLGSLGGNWMWDNIVEGYIEVEWIKTALETNTFIGATDGSYNRERASTVSGSGWLICCTRAKRLLHGSFYEISPKAGSYRGELLGLVALHTLITSIASYYKLERPAGKICCDNLAALCQSDRC